MNIIRELRHPFIIRYFDRIIDKHATKLYMVTEFCENGDLGALIKRHQQKGYVMVVASVSFECACTLPTHGLRTSTTTAVDSFQPR